MAVEFTAHAQNFGSFGIFGRRKAQVRMPDKLYGASSLVAPTVPRYESAATLFVNNNTYNLDAIKRNAIFSLMDRISCSENSIVVGVCHSEVKMHSKIWKRWAIELGMEWEAIVRG